jgi:hypothetical protein
LTIAGTVNIISYQNPQSREKELQASLYFKARVILLYLQKVITRTNPHSVTLVLIVFTSLVCFNPEMSYFRRIIEICFKGEINGKTLNFKQTNMNC